MTCNTLINEELNFLLQLQKVTISTPSNTNTKEAKEEKRNTFKKMLFGENVRNLTKTQKNQPRIHLY